MPSPELLTRLTQAMRRPPPPDPLEPLWPRERDVLRLIARGHSNRQIALEAAAVTRQQSPASLRSVTAVTTVAVANKGTMILLHTANM
jgi:FixJ family two-component response regulator